jgi:hypothetical protein
MVRRDPNQLNRVHRQTYQNIPIQRQISLQQIHRGPNFRMNVPEM